VESGARRHRESPRTVLAVRWSSDAIRSSLSRCADLGGVRSTVGGLRAYLWSRRTRGEGRRGSVLGIERTTRLHNNALKLTRSAWRLHPRPLQLSAVFYGPRKRAGGVAPALTICLLLMAFARSAHACVCSETGTVKDEVESSRAVFLGRLIGLRIDVVDVEHTKVERTVATFRVERSWKGPKLAKVDVWTCGDQVTVCTCGVDFKLGEQYLVFASGKPLSTASCSRTGVASVSEAIIAELAVLRGSR
jgi:hypothetical protein